MRATSITAFLLMSLLCVSVLASEQEKAGIPDEASRKAALKDIQDLFKDDYSNRDPKSRGEFAGRLIGEAVKSKGDPPSCYALLEEAISLATEAGAVETAFEAIRKLDSFFDLAKAKRGETATDLKLSVLSKAQRAARRPEEAEAIAVGYFDVAREATAKGEFREAQDAVRKASSISRKARNVSLAKQIADYSKVIPELKREYGSVEKADLSAAIDMGQKKGNLDIGRFLCFVKGDWAKGLEYLQWTGDKDLAEVVKADLSNPKDARAKYDVGEGWRKLSNKERNSLHKGRYRSRALTWYEEALEEAEGLLKTKLEKMVVDFRREEGLVYLTDLKPIKAEVGTGELFIYGGGSIDPKLQVMVGGKPAKRFIYAHADSTLVFEVPSGFTLFSAVGVRKDDLDSEGHWAYKVLVDGKQIYQSEPLVSYPNREVKISVSLPRGAKEIELFVDSLGSGSFDRSVWAYPTFSR